jgi:uncharacterized membrane protein YgdD (TMEM256/DUF423 family)
MAGLSGALGVALGAFGAHALRPWLPLQQMTIYETAVRYQLLHALALLGVAALAAAQPARAAALAWPARGFLLGSVLFPGSLYALALTGWSWFGAIAPLGGAAWILAWLGLAWSCWKGR